MKFLVTRRSVHPSEYLDIAPVPGAMKEPMVVEERIRPRKLREKARSLFMGRFHPVGREWWDRIGVRHRQEGEFLVREFDTEGWFLEVGDFQGLKELVRTQGAVLLKPPAGAGAHPELEIWDVYREELED